MAAPKNGLVPLETFIVKNQERNLDQFLVLYPDPFLLIMFDRNDPDQSKSYHTMGFHEPTIDPSGGAMCVVATLAKSAGNPFAMVTVGRTQNNDITIETGQISKVHCYFKRLEDGRTTVADSNSKNGTEVNGLPLRARAPYILESGDTIVLAELVTMSFLSPEGLYKRVLNFGK